MKNKYIFILVIFILFFTKPAETVLSEYTAKYFFTYKKKDEPIHSSPKINATALKTIAHLIHEHYEKLFQQKMFNGCVLVGIDNTIIYANAFGYSDIQQKICLNTNSLFQLASVSKIFTSVSVLKLYEQKLLNINDEVKKYIPEFPYSNITIKHLLNHTSGLPNYLHLMQDINRQDTVLTHWSVLQFLINKKIRPEFKAGRRYKYCNTNYAVLACLIEKVSKMSYSDFLKKEIFNPCNMKHTNTIHFTDIFDNNTTTSHEYKNKHLPFYAGDFILGDKSIYSDIYDLFQFSQKFLNHEILNDSTINLMTKGVRTNKYGMLYGLGIRIKNYEDKDKTIWFHNGWWHGYRTAFQMRPKDKLTVIILSNHIYKTAYHTYPVFEYIDEILYNQKNTEDNKQFTYPSLSDE